MSSQSASSLPSSAIEFKRGQNTKQPENEGLFNNRIVQLTIYGIALVASTRLYANWYFFGNLFLKAGKYSYLCSPDSEPVGAAMCHEQQLKLEGIYSLFSGCELFGALPAGLALDFIGPRKTALIGLIMFAASWMFLLHESSPALDVAPLGAILGGLSINIIGYPAFCIADKFPGNESLCACFNAAGQSFATLVPVILDAYWSRRPDLPFATMMSFYLLCFAVPVVAVYIAALPLQRPVADVANQDSPRANEEGEVEKQGLNVESLVKAMLSVEFGLLFIVNMVLLTLCQYYQRIMPEVVGVKITEFFGQVLPFGSFISIVWGKLCDAIKTPPTIIIQAIMMGTMFFLALLGVGRIQYISAILYLSVLSFVYSIKVTYVTETYPVYLQGTLFGIAGALSGLSSATISIMRSTLNTEAWCLILCTMAASQIPVALIMWHRQASKIEKKLE